MCDLIEARKPAGLLAYLDEESLIPKGTDDSFYAKVTKQLASHEHFTMPKSLEKKTVFTIRHYAGDSGAPPAFAELL